MSKTKIGEGKEDNKKTNTQGDKSKSSRRSVGDFVIGLNFYIKGMT